MTPPPDGKVRLNVGCGRDVRPGWWNLDRQALPGVDLVRDLENPKGDRLPFADDEVDEFLLSHIVEHVVRVLPMMQEMWRVAKPGALMTIRCPYGSSDDAEEDPTHVRRMFLQSAFYFSQPAYWRADYAYRGDWQPERITLLCDPEFSGWRQRQLLQKVQRERNIVREMIVELRAVKPARQPLRELIRLPKIELAV